MRLSFCFSIACLGITALASTPAKADLIGTGTNTVDPLFYLGSLASTPEDEGSGLYGSTTIANPGGTSFTPGPNSETAIKVTGTQITLTNELNFPYCTVALPCPDSFTGFEFKFSSGVDITGISVDASSAADFQPIALTLVSATDFLVNLTGLSPGVGESLTINLTFPGSGPTPTPEPMSAAILGMGLAGLLAARRRKATLDRSAPV